MNWVLWGSDTGWVQSFCYEEIFWQINLENKYLFPLHNYDEKLSKGIQRVYKNGQETEKEYSNKLEDKEVFLMSYYSFPSKKIKRVMIPVPGEGVVCLPAGEHILLAGE